MSRKIDSPEAEKWRTKLIQGLRKERQARGIEQKQLARKLGIHTATMSNWETGLRQPSTNALTAWALALDLEFEVRLRRIGGRDGMA